MSTIKIAITDSEYKQWISNIERRFRQQQIKAAVQVNSSKIEFYWSLGRDICEMHVEERYCKRFYLLYSQLFEKVPQVGEIFPSSCGHHKAILDRCENEPMKALFYAAKTLEHSWSRAVLEKCRNFII